VSSKSRPSGSPLTILNSQLSTSREPAALGVRAHSGWAALVAVAGTPRSPSVLIRRRIELVDPSVEGAKQPYHEAEGKKLPKAGEIIRRCSGDASKLAGKAFREVIAELGRNGHRVAGCGLLLASGRPLPALEAILASHALIHAADGELFRDALAGASEACGVPVTRVREKELLPRVTAELRISTEEVQNAIRELGRSLGPPWTQDEKYAALAGWLALEKM
jgi:hypothetical protein